MHYWRAFTWFSAFDWYWKWYRKLSECALVRTKCIQPNSLQLYRKPKISSNAGKFTSNKNNVQKAVRQSTHVNTKQINRKSYVQIIRITEENNKLTRQICIYNESYSIFLKLFHTTHRHFSNQYLRLSGWLFSTEIISKLITWPLIIDD